MDAQDTANNILVDLDTESQRDLLGNAEAAPVWITPFHGNDGVDEFFLRSLRVGPTPALGREQQAVLSLFEHVVEIEQSVCLRWGRIEYPVTVGDAVTDQ